MSVAEGVVESVHFEFASLVVAVSSMLLWCPLRVSTVIQSAGFVWHLRISHTVDAGVHREICASLVLVALSTFSVSRRRCGVRVVVYEFVVCTLCAATTSPTGAHRASNHYYCCNHTTSVSPTSSR